MLDINTLKAISKNSIKLQISFCDGCISEVNELRADGYITERRARGETECLRLLQELERRYVN